MSPNPPHRVAHPAMFQSWRAVAFLHWRYPAAALQALLPAGLTVHRFRSEAWIGITPFRVEGLRLPLLPAVPWLSSFPETNVRTYVLGPDGEPGIWFFTLEASRSLAVIGARALYGLPYHWARMTVQRQGALLRYTSRRKQAQFHAAISRGETILPSRLENFLTARFRLYSRHAGQLWYADVEHPPWPLQSARLVSLTQNLAQAVGLSEPLAGEPLVHFSPGVRTRIGWPHLVPMRARLRDI